MPSIAPPPLRGTLFFVDTADDDAWSESYWINQSIYPFGLNDLATIASARLTTLTEENQLVYGRVSATNIKGDTLALGLSGLSFGNYQAGSTPKKLSLPTDQCVFVRWESGDIVPYHIVQPFHGIPKSALFPDHDELLDPAQPWVTQMTNFLNLVQSKCLLVTRTRAGDPPPNPGRRSIYSFRIPQKVRRRNTGRPFGLFKGHRVPA
jgi:hypothetical protein